MTDITEYSFLGDAGLLPGSATPFLLPAAAASLHLAGSTCTGIILHPAVERSSPPVRYCHAITDSLQVCFKSDHESTCKYLWLILADDEECELPVHTRRDDKKKAELSKLCEALHALRMLFGCMGSMLF